MAHLLSAYGRSPNLALRGQRSSPLRPDRTDTSCADADGYTASEYWNNSLSSADVSFKSLRYADLCDIEASSLNYTISPCEPSSEFVTEDSFAVSLYGHARTMSTMLDLPPCLMSPCCSTSGGHGNLTPDMSEQVGRKSFVLQNFLDLEKLT